MKILILCTGNSCRSQMAEGILKSFDSRLEVESGGTFPAPNVSSKAVKVMSEIGIDISGNVPNSVFEYTDEAWDYVITVCDNAREICPVFIGRVGQQLHIGFEDPYEAQGTEEEQLAVYRRVRDEIYKDFKTFYENIIKSKL